MQLLEPSVKVGLEQGDAQPDISPPLDGASFLNPVDKVLAEVRLNSLDRTSH